MLGHVFLKRYETIRLLGEGGMGRVYLAQDRQLPRQVVVKIMHDHIAADPTFRERFKRETELMASFQHPYAVTLYDAAESDKGPCIVMEYINGETLDVILARHQRLSPERVNRLLQQLCEVLQAAHSRGIIHRDLKPANLIIVNPDTPHEFLKVMDFGLAKLLGPNAKASVTNHEFAVGTPGYMCPEQARGEEMDNRGDLYSVGVILFELLTGQLPFAGRETYAVLLAHATEDPPSFASLGASARIPLAIEHVVQMCLAKDPEQRPRTARDLGTMFSEAVASAQAMVSKAPAQPVSLLNPPLYPPRRDGILPKVLETASAAIDPQAATIPNFGPSGPRMPLGGATSPPEPVVVKAPSPPSVPSFIDPLAIIHTIDAWMPEQVAAYKLRGFIQEAGGELVESVPGRIQIRLGGKGCMYTAPVRGLSWLGLGRRIPIDLELRLQRANAGRDLLRITVIFTSPGQNLNADTAWRALCDQIFCHLRSYLMPQSQTVSDPIA
jgi:serine/threonine protein kinase